MGDKFVIGGDGGPGSVFFSSNCKNCRQAMSINGGNRNRFSMRCNLCGLRLMVFVGDDPNAPLQIWRDECPEGVNFNDYLRSLPEYRAWEQRYRGKSPAIVGPVLAAPG